MTAIPETFLLNHIYYSLYTSLFISTRAKILDYEVALNMTTYLKNEDKYVPWRAFLDSLHFIKGMISKQGSYVLLRVSFIIQLYSLVLYNIIVDNFR